MSENWDPFNDETQHPQFAPMEHRAPAAPVAPAAPAVPSRRAIREAAEVKKEKKRRKRHKGMTAALTIVALAAVGGVGYVFGVPIYKSITTRETTVTDYPGPGTTAVTVVVAPGDSGEAIGEALVKAGVVATTKAFIAAYTDNPDSASIQPGTYTLRKEMSASDAVSALLDEANRTQVSFTIPEGWVALQIYPEISQATGIPVEEIQQAAMDVKAIGLPPEANDLVEGWLFPATYDVAPDATATQILTQMVTKTKEVLRSVGVPSDKWHDTIVLASMVEKEARLPEDRPKVARVFLNRLALKPPMLLQSDATVAYGADEHGILTSEDARNQANPYNTYKNPGLPVGAICNPGQSAIEAVFNPADGPWLFFVTVDPETGATEFNTTLADHDKAVAKLNAWIAAHPDYSQG